MLHACMKHLVACMLCYICRCSQLVNGLCVGDQRGHKFELVPKITIKHAALSRSLLSCRRHARWYGLKLLRLLATMLSICELSCKVLKRLHLVLLTMGIISVYNMACTKTLYWQKRTSSVF